MVSNRAKCEIEWRALKDISTLSQKTMGPDVPTPFIPITSNT